VDYCKNNSCCKLARPGLLCPAIAKNQRGLGPCGPSFLQSMIVVGNVILMGKYNENTAITKHGM